MRPGCRTTNVVLRVPSVSGSAVTSGAWSTSASATKSSISSGRGTMNIVFAKRAWYGLAVTTRTPMRWSGSAPAKWSTT